MSNYSLDEVNDAIQNSIHIEAIPTISLHLYNASLKNDFDCKEAAFYIKKDPGITVQLLKASNSAFYCHGNKIKSVEHALVYLGLRMVRNLIYTIEMGNAFKSVIKNQEFNITKLWKHTLAGAMLAQELSSFADSDISDTIYMSALTRNIGLLFLINNLPDLFRDIVLKCEKEKISYLKATDDLCGYDFKYIAFLLGYKWDLPKTIINTFREGIFPSGDKVVSDIYNYINIAENILQATDYEIWDENYEISSFEIFINNKFELSPIQDTVKKIIEIVEQVASTFLIA